MADISRIMLQDQVYNLKDEELRQMFAILLGWEQPENRENKFEDNN